ncbi:FadR/GntR family transcriptional regulator [Brevibacterium aurantiacum]|uniref:HTH gntR-type domain-containing protein n=1 Tax=Brevibacterium aurantiacum TaxID=273384 RepID=A0A2A3Z1X2_BREAU|nr:FCD domain-containing protein [Brevibacterium aurantiacum]PCC45527.1 hypothetical protein CIK64_15445 [Brevibacterium aurantiacum]
MVSPEAASTEAGNFTPLPPNPKVSTITDRLTSAIVTGQFLPGTRLPSERALAESISVGRSTVRKALLQLSDAGLVETRLGRFGGTFVLESTGPGMGDSVRRVFGKDLEDLKSALDVIGLGYAMVAEAAAIRHTEADVDAMKEALTVFCSAVDRQDRVQAQQADSHFHFRIIDATHQPALHEVIRSLDRRTNIGAPLHIWGAGNDSFDQRAAHEHRLILEAIVARDRTAAYDLSYEHTQMDVEIISQIIEA